MEAGIAPRILDAIQGQAPRSVADTYGEYHGEGDWEAAPDRHGRQLVDACHRQGVQNGGPIPPPT